MHTLHIGRCSTPEVYAYIITVLSTVIRQHCLTMQQPWWPISDLRLQSAQRNTTTSTHTCSSTMLQPPHTVYKQEDIGALAVYHSAGVMDSCLAGRSDTLSQWLALN